MNKVLSLLQTAPSIESKAKDYEKRIRVSLQKEMIEPIEDKIAKLETEIEDQLDFSLSTDLNKGIDKISRPEVEDRVRKAIKLKYNKGLAELELKLMKSAFDDLFEDEQV